MNMQVRKRSLTLVFAAIPLLLSCVGSNAASVSPGRSFDNPCVLAKGSSLPIDMHIESITHLKPHDGIGGVKGSARVSVAFCRLQGVIEQEIGFELWLPLPQHWNGQMLGAGVGGQAGSMALHELARGVDRGYASASTDTGHKKSEKHWLLNRPDRALNYAERANHLLAVKVKDLLKLFYGRLPERAVFIGCSGGGRQALTAMQRYPADYDGIIAGAPGVNTPEMSARRLWEIIQHDKHQGLLTDADWQFIAEQGQQYCDVADGHTDGVARNPMQCDFAISQLACEHAQSQTTACLSAEQVAFAERIYASLFDENGKQIDSGLLPGVRVLPAPLPEPFTPGPSYLATVLFADGVHSDPAWDVRQFQLSRDLPAIDRVMNLHADNPNIDAFIARGGKLIMYHGWADPLVAPQSTINYFEALQERYAGTSVMEDAVRLFMVPGMDHCRGGNVPDRFGGAGGFAAQAEKVSPETDLLSALEQWLVLGRGPNVITAVSFQGQGSAKHEESLCRFDYQLSRAGADTAQACKNRTF